MEENRELTSSLYRRFAEEYGLMDEVTVLRKGALLAQDPHNYEFMEELSEEDKAAIAHEHAHKWR